MQVEDGGLLGVRAESSPGTGLLRPLEVLTWNLKGSQREAILQQFQSFTAEILVLTEYRVPRKGDILREQLRQAGWIYQESTALSHADKGVLIASKIPITRQTFAPARCEDPEAVIAASTVLVSIDDSGVDLLGIRIPYKPGPVADVLYAQVLHLAKRRRKRGLIVAGEFHGTVEPEGHKNLWVGDLLAVLDDCRQGDHGRRHDHILVTRGRLGKSLVGRDEPQGTAVKARFELPGRA